MCARRGVFCLVFFSLFFKFRDLFCVWTVKKLICFWGLSVIFHRHLFDKEFIGVKCAAFVTAVEMVVGLWVHLCLKWCGRSFYLLRRDWLSNFDARICRSRVTRAVWTKCTHDKAISTSWRKVSGSPSRIPFFKTLFLKYFRRAYKLNNVDIKEQILSRSTFFVRLFLIVGFGLFF